MLTLLILLSPTTAKPNYARAQHAEMPHALDLTPTLSSADRIVELDDPHANELVHKLDPAANKAFPPSVQAALRSLSDDVELSDLRHAHIAGTVVDKAQHPPLDIIKIANSTSQHCNITGVPSSRGLTGIKVRLQGIAQEPRGLTKDLLGQKLRSALPGQVKIETFPHKQTVLVDGREKSYKGWRVILSTADTNPDHMLLMQAAADVLISDELKLPVWVHAAHNSPMQLVQHGRPLIKLTTYTPPQLVKEQLVPAKVTITNYMGEAGLPLRAKAAHIIRDAAEMLQDIANTQAAQPARRQHALRLLQLIEVEAITSRPKDPIINFTMHYPAAATVIEAAGKVTISSRVGVLTIDTNTTNSAGFDHCLALQIRDPSILSTQGALHLLQALQAQVPAYSRGLAERRRQQAAANGNQLPDAALHGTMLRVLVNGQPTPLENITAEQAANAVYTARGQTSLAQLTEQAALGLFASTSAVVVLVNFAVKHSQAITIMALDARQVQLGNYIVLGAGTRHSTLRRTHWLGVKGAEQSVVVLDVVVAINKGWPLAKLLKKQRESKQDAATKARAIAQLRADALKLALYTPPEPLAAPQVLSPAKEGVRQLDMALALMDDVAGGDLQDAIDLLADSPAADDAEDGEPAHNQQHAPADAEEDVLHGTASKAQRARRRRDRHQAAQQHGHRLRFDEGSDRPHKHPRSTGGAGDSSLADHMQQHNLQSNNDTASSSYGSPTGGSQRTMSQG